MGSKRLHHCHHHRWKLWLSVATVTALLLLLFSSLPSAVGLHPTQHLNAKLGVEDDEKARQKLKWLEHGSGSDGVRVESTLSRLRGPGSWPPRCISRCGRCRPCKPVHVSIQPGSIMPLEYYPEAWRCKCDNNLFMP